MAVVGKNYAVLERGRLRTSGFLTWLVWAFVHILALPQLQSVARAAPMGLVVFHGPAQFASDT
jgi:NADH dehydrogenase FAD-containing subunit